MNLRESLKKSLHKAILKAYQNGRASRTVDKIVADIEDPNDVAQVPSHELPAPSQNVLHKDITLSEIHQKKQANAMAKLGQPSKAPKMDSGLKPPVTAAGSESSPSMKPKAIKPLKTFMQKKEGKRNN